MTPRQRVMAVLNGKAPDRVPFTWKQPHRTRGAIERQLRNDGMAVCWECPVLTVQRPNVRVIRESYIEQGRSYTRETFRTPIGQISQLWATHGGYDSNLCIEHLIKQPEDYAVARFIIRDEVYAPNYEQFTRAEQVIGEDGMMFGGWMPPTPIMAMLWEWLGPIQFVFDSVDHLDQFEALYHDLFDQQRQQYHLAARGPAKVIHIEENLTSDMIGLQRFKKYALPCYNAFAQIIHPTNKLLAAHMDGRLAALAEAIAESDLDIIEAFCPAPDGDLALADARRIWKNKIIWINFPSAAHLWPPHQIEALALQLLQEAGSTDRFLFGITEDIPEGVWDVSMPILSRVLKQYGAIPTTHAHQTFNLSHKEQRLV